MCCQYVCYDHCCTPSCVFHLALFYVYFNVWYLSGWHHYVFFNRLNGVVMVYFLTRAWRPCVLFPHAGLRLPWQWKWFLTMPIDVRCSSYVCIVSRLASSVVSSLCFMFLGVMLFWSVYVSLHGSVVFDCSAIYVKCFFSSHICCIAEDRPIGIWSFVHAMHMAPLCHVADHSALSITGCVSLPLSLTCVPCPVHDSTLVRANIHVYD